jgi:hypothetical protein
MNSRRVKFVSGRKVRLQRYSERPCDQKGWGERGTADRIPDAPAALLDSRTDVQILGFNAVEETWAVRHAGGFELRSLPNATTL